ncbi:MAG: alkaline phosphatase family protein [Planctomycetota bacterium]
MARAKRLIIVGIDSIALRVLDQMIERGYCPTIKNLIETGCYAQGRSFCPVETGTNWAVLSTGASPAVTGVNMGTHVVGQPLNYMARGFPSDLCKAEQIWNAAARGGRRSVIFDYPQSRPINCDSVIHVGGDGAPGQSPYALAEMHGYRTDGPYPDLDKGLSKMVSRIEPRPAQGWPNLPHTTPPSLEVELPVEPWPANGPDRVSSLWALIVADGGSRYNKVIFFGSKDPNTKLGEVAFAGAPTWGDWLVNDFETDKGVIRAATRPKVFRLSPDGMDVHIYLHQIFPVSGFAHPADLEPKLLDACGPYYPNTCRQQSINAGAADVWTFTEEVDFTVDWYCKAMEVILGKEDWDLFIQKWHPPDFCYHFGAFMIDERHPLYDPKRHDEGWDFWGRVMGRGDDLVRTAMEAAGGDAIVAVMSDHGGKMVLPGEAGHMNLRPILEKAGLIVSTPGGGVDWSRTKAWAAQHYVWVNLKGRDPDGIVEPGEEYEAVRQQIIDAILDARDPHTGRHAANLVCRREDAAMVGIGGGHSGDVFIWSEEEPPKEAITKEEFERQHPGMDIGTWEWPRHNSGTHCPDPFIIMNGPGFKKGYRKERDVWINYFAPTLAHAFGIPIPKDADGGVIWDFLE